MWALPAGAAGGVGGGRAAGPPRACATRKTAPARASTRGGVSVVQAAEIGAGVAAGAGGGVWLQLVGTGALVGRPRAVAGRGCGGTLQWHQKSARRGSRRGLPSKAARGESEGNQEGPSARDGCARASAGVRCRSRGGRRLLTFPRGAGDGMRSFTTAGSLREVIPLPSCHGESSPEPFRPLGRKGGPASGCLCAGISKKSRLRSQRRRTQMLKAEGVHRMRANAWGESG